ncbi:Proline utilization trans-activator [Diaporthe amygdali]|uniref:Proline utilization trans-activator n=1 Tax=Phomopsis amygdali TaxID=1214568 RepID=UPI0022FEEA4B|nr:Proline utilization trans-activator [Diaporthe amygdali]KAJ0104007.1 Proline utilization trans-activator [Diaporthe amygdali]
MASEHLRPKKILTSVEEPVIRPVACHRCRQRRSYCSKDRPQCTRCEAGGFDCVYEEARKITVNEAYLRDLEAKVKAYEDAHPRLAPKPSAAHVPIQSSNLAELMDGVEEPDDQIRLPEAFSELSLETPENPSSSFKGPAHSDHFLRSFRKASLQFDDGSLDCDTDFYDRAALPSRRLPNTSHIRLPPIEIARQLFAAQYTYIGTIFSFVSPTAFETLLHEAYQSPTELPDQYACLTFAKLLVILAFGKMYSVNQWIDYDGPPGFDYFTRVLQLLPDLHEQGSVLFVETLALVGFFMQNLNRRDAASLYIGSALRMAITLGLHQEPTSSSLDQHAKEHRRRVWWSVYSLDRIHCVKSGNPITIHDDDIGVELPSRLPNEPEFCPAVVLRHYTKLSQINGQIMTSIYRRKPKSGPSLMVAVQSIILALSQWQQELPDELRFEPIKLSTSRESVSTLLYYSQCIHMTARPLLFHVVQARLRGGLADKESDWRKGLTQTTINVIEMCVFAAKDTINMMTIAAQKNLVATYGYMDSDYAFSAAIVLVMVCVAFPTNEQNNQSMNAALELLRGISHRGNSHLAARYHLLAHLRAKFVPFAVPAASTASTPGPSNVGGFEIRSLSNNTTLSTVQPLPEGTPKDALANSQASKSTLFGPTDPLSGTAIHGPGLSQPLPELFDFNLLNNPSLADEIFYDVDMTGVNSGNNQEFWEEAFASLAGDSGSNLVNSLEWSQAAMDHFERNGDAIGPEHEDAAWWDIDQTLDDAKLVPMRQFSVEDTALNFTLEEDWDSKAKKSLWMTTPGAHIAVLDTRLLHESGQNNEMSHVTALRAADLAGDNYPVEYLVYGPVRGMALTCVALDNIKVAAQYSQFSPNEWWTSKEDERWAKLGVASFAEEVTRARDVARHITGQISAGVSHPNPTRHLMELTVLAAELSRHRAPRKDDSPTSGLAPAGAALAASSAPVPFPRFTQAEAYSVFDVLSTETSRLEWPVNFWEMIHVAVNRRTYFDGLPQLRLMLDLVEAVMNKATVERAKKETSRVISATLRGLYPRIPKDKTASPASVQIMCGSEPVKKRRRIEEGEAPRRSSKSFSKKAREAASEAQAALIKFSLEPMPRGVSAYGT